MFCKIIPMTGSTWTPASGYKIQKRTLEDLQIVHLLHQSVSFLPPDSEGLECLTPRKGQHIFHWHLHPKGVKHPMALRSCLYFFLNSPIPPKKNLNINNGQWYWLWLWTCFKDHQHSTLTTALPLLPLKIQPNMFCSLALFLATPLDELTISLTKLAFHNGW